MSTANGTTISCSNRSHPPAPGRWRRTRLSILVLAVLLLGAYVGIDLFRQPLNQSARAELGAAGKAGVFVETSLGTMHARVVGPSGGPVVLLVHGGVVGGYAFHNWMNPLAGAGFRVIAPDLLGYGYSDRPRMPYTRDFYVAQLAELLDGLDIEGPVQLIGASQGGGIVTAFAEAHPERVRSLVLMAPNGGGSVRATSPVLLTPVLGDWIFRIAGPSVMRSMMATAYKGNPAREGMLAWMDEQARYRGYGDGVLNSVRHTLANDALAWQPDALVSIGKSGVPVLAMWGTADSTVPIAQAEVWRQRIPQFRLVPLEGLGHAITFGQADQVLRTVIPFLNASAPTEGGELESDGSRGEGIQEAAPEGAK